MRISTRDCVIAGAVALLLVVLLLGSRKKLGPDVPPDATHGRFYQRLGEGERRQHLEHGCIRCHVQSQLSAAHPPKEECMVCHLI